MFLHARKGHAEPLGKGCDRSVRTPELLQNAASGGVRERAERGIAVGLAILYHMVQYSTWVTALQWEAERPLHSPQTRKELHGTPAPPLAPHPSLRRRRLERLHHRLDGPAPSQAGLDRPPRLRGWRRRFHGRPPQARDQARQLPLPRFPRSRADE